MTEYFFRNLLDVLPLVLSLLAGMAAGFALRRKPRVVVGAERLLMWAVFVLLFLLGLTTGLNRQVVRNLHNLGLQALLLTLGAVAGSLLFGWVLYVWAFRGVEREE